MAEVKRLLDATRCLQHQAALSVAYGAGLRVAHDLRRCIKAHRLGNTNVHMIAGTDEDGDCHAIFTQSAMRAIGHFKRMSAVLGDLRGNENFELLRPVIADFDADRDGFDCS